MSGWKEEEKECGEHVIRMDAERLVNISKGQYTCR